MYIIFAMQKTLHGVPLFSELLALAKFCKYELFL